VREIAQNLDNFHVVLEKQRKPEHGDYSSTAPLQLARTLGKPPREIAEQLRRQTAQAIDHAGVCEPLELAGAGFLNIRLKSMTKLAVIAQILKQGASYGRVPAKNPQKVMVEFVSANPTGPLHLGHARQAALGDALCKLFESQGWQVTREFYYNDAGVQIDNLARSVQARCRGLTPDDATWPEDGYRGDYIADVANAFLAKATVIADDMEYTASGNIEDAEEIRHFAVACLRHEQDLDLHAFGIRFDVFSHESALYTDGKVEITVQNLIKSGHAFEQDGALWLRTTDFGDDKDRVMRKADGSYTYFVPDIAYHVDKWQRGFVRVIDELGADHHSTITRVRAGLQALDMGIPQDWPDYVLHQMVAVMSGGEEMKISKRAGSYITLRDLIEEVGCDATRYFLVERRADSQLVFDIDLARAQTNNNPVYYIQYAHARICQVLNLWNGDIASLNSVALTPLNAQHEAALMQRLSEFPETVEAAAQELAPHMIANYLKDLASDLHSYYNAEQFLVDDEALKLARLALISATRQVLKNGLQLLGVSAPTVM
jgi:arginyl-tRNA synthetase